MSQLQCDSGSGRYWRVSRRADLRDREDDQRAGHVDPPRRAERPHGPRPRPPRLRDGDGEHRPLRLGRGPQDERAGPEDLPRRGLARTPSRSPDKPRKLRTDVLESALVRAVIAIAIAG